MSCNLGEMIRGTRNKQTGSRDDSNCDSNSKLIIYLDHPYLFAVGWHHQQGPATMHGMYQQCNSTTFIMTVHFTDIGVGRAVLLLMLWGLAMHTWGHGRDTLQGYSANGHCWDILQLRPARMICNWALPGAAGIFCH